MVGIAIDLIGCKSHKQSHKLEVARAILILGTVGGIPSELYRRVPMPPLVWALGTLTARVRCPLGIGNRTKYL